TVVLDDVNDREIAAHQVHELPDADGRCVTVAAHADADQFAIREQSASRNRGHAPVDGVEAVRAAQKVRGSLRRTADAAGLDYVLGLNAHLVHGFDNSLRDGVVTATGA